MHICELPTRRTLRWWTCEFCGQMWRKLEGVWRLTERSEVNEDGR